MRTTLNIDGDVLDRARDTARKLDKPFRAVINDALRKGLAQIEQPAKKRKYTTKSHRLGLKEGYDLNNIQELLSRIDGEDAR